MTKVSDINDVLRAHGRAAVRQAHDAASRFKANGDGIIAPQQPTIIRLTFFEDISIESARKSWLIKNVMAKGETSTWIAPPGAGNQLCSPARSLQLSPGGIGLAGGMIGLVLVREAYPGPPTVKGDVSRGSGNSKEGPFWFNASGVSRSILIAMAQPEPLFGPVLNGAFEGCTGQPRHGRLRRAAPFV